MKQLETAEDIHQLVSEFYDKVLQDEVLAPFFARLDFAAHFDRWQALFNQTIDELFEGELAQQATQCAAVIGWTINAKMNPEH